MQLTNLVYSILIGLTLIIPGGLFFIIRFCKNTRVSAPIFAILYSLPFTVGLLWLADPDFDAKSLVVLGLYTISWILYGYGHITADIDEVESSEAETACRTSLWYTLLAVLLQVIFIILEGIGVLSI